MEGFYRARGEEREQNMGVMSQGVSFWAVASMSTCHGQFGH